MAPHGHNDRTGSQRLMLQLTLHPMIHLMVQLMIQMMFLNKEMMLELGRNDLK